MRYFWYLTIAAISAASVWQPTVALAQKKPSSGPPPGVIYFRHDGSMWQMDAAGTPASRVRLADAPEYGDPSQALHRDKRWFAFDVSYVPELAPVFPNQRQFTEIHAGDTGGSLVRLLSDLNLEILSQPRWSTDDQSLTFLAERWDEVNGQMAATDAGVYSLAISFDANGTPQAGELTFLLDLSVQLRGGAAGVPGYAEFELTGHSWNPTGTQVAFGVRIDRDQKRSQEIWISDVTNATHRILVSGSGVGWPEWSPDGSRIAFSRSGQVVLNLATGRTKTLSNSASDSWGGLRWSPTSAYTVVYHWDNLLPGYDAMYRCTADLGSRTTLSAGLADPPQPFNYFIPVGWRK